MEITAVLKKYAFDKANRLTRYFKNIQKMEIIVTPEKDSRYSAEMIAHAPRGSVLVCHSTDQTATAALDTAVEKMERHLIKLKDRLQRKNGRSASGASRKFSTASAEDIPVGEDSSEIWW